MAFNIHEPTGNRWHTCRIDLRWSDFDQYQHVNNAKYLEFGQDARMIFLKDVLTELDIAVPPFFVRHATIDYPRPLSPGESQVAVSTFITHIGKKSFTTRQQVKDGVGRVACTIDTVMVAMDMLTGKSREWTEADLKNLRMFFIPVDGDDDGPGISSRTEAKQAKEAHQHVGA